EGEPVEEVEIEIGKVVDGIEPVGRVGLAEARMFRNDDVEFLRQRLHDRKPRPCPAGAVQKQQRRPAPAAHQLNVAAADRDSGDDGVGHFTGSRVRSLARTWPSGNDGRRWLVSSACRGCPNVRALAPPPTEEGGRASRALHRANADERLGPYNA